jgi:hypothetical protein
MARPFLIEERAYPEPTDLQPLHLLAKIMGGFVCLQELCVALFFSHKVPAQIVSGFVFLRNV